MLLFISMYTDKKVVLGVMMGILFLSGIMLLNQSREDKREITFNVLHEPLNLIQATEAGKMTGLLQEASPDKHYVIVKEGELIK